MLENCNGLFLYTVESFLRTIRIYCNTMYQTRIYNVYSVLHNWIRKFCVVLHVVDVHIWQNYWVWQAYPWAHYWIIRTVHLIPSDIWWVWNETFILFLLILSEVDLKLGELGIQITQGEAQILVLVVTGAGHFDIECSNQHIYALIGEKIAPQALQADKPQTWLQDTRVHLTYSARTHKIQPKGMG